MTDGWLCHCGRRKAAGACNVCDVDGEGTCICVMTDEELQAQNSSADEVFRQEMERLNKLAGIDVRRPLDLKPMSTAEEILSRWCRHGRAHAACTVCLYW